MSAKSLSALALPVMLAAGLSVSLSACAAIDLPTAKTSSSDVFSSKSIDLTEVAMRWDHRPEADKWTARTLAALDSHGTNLVSTMPADIDTWCPAYKAADETGRKAFWTGLLSTLAKHESTWNPKAVGGGGKWFGLVQISPATARHYGCEARSGAELKNGSANLACAVRILDTTVPRDGVVSQGMRGVAADWGPFHSSKKRNDMISWMNAQPYCQG